jgi:DNA polymerase-3 subunit delta
MIYIWHGADDFTIKTYLDELREAIGIEDVRDANTTEIDAAELTPAHLGMACRSVPFLAERRLVVVRGLLSRTQRTPTSGRRRDREGTGSKQSDYDGLEESIQNLPDTTDVVFVDGRLGKNNSLLTRLRRLENVKVREFPFLRGEELRNWVQVRFRERNVDISPAALRTLCDLVSGNLWVMNGEIEKLALFCGNRAVEEGDIALLVSAAHETNIFAMIDAVFEGRPEDALRLMRLLLNSGTPVQAIMELIRRQLNHLVKAKDIMVRGVSRMDIARELEIASDFVARKVVAQARSFSGRQLVNLYELLLEIDVAIKSGEVEEDLGLEMLIVRTTDRP